jgi:ADP-ribose pyrophosphatase YjhB (NUDIX family)
MVRKLKTGIDFIGVTTPFYCNDGKGNFLLHKRSKIARDEHGRWDFGGGQLEFGEELQQGVLREVQEEYGLKGIIQEQLEAHSIIRIQNGIKTHWLAIPFFVKVDVNKAKIMEATKVSEIGIFALDKLPKPLHSGAKYTMKHYLKNFQRYKIKH